jgi:hypothetical protein
VRASRSAAIGVVAELVDVHAPFSVRIVTGDVVSNGGRRGFGGLLESHLASDLGVSSKNGDCRTSVSVYASAE